MLQLHKIVEAVLDRSQPVNLPSVEKRYKACNLAAGMLKEMPTGHMNHFNGPCVKTGTHGVNIPGTDHGAPF